MFSKMKANWKRLIWMTALVATVVGAAEEPESKQVDLPAIAPG